MTPLTLAVIMITNGLPTENLEIPLVIIDGNYDPRRITYINSENYVSNNDYWRIIIDNQLATDILQ